MSVWESQAPRLGTPGHKGISCGVVCRNSGLPLVGSPGSMCDPATCLSESRVVTHRNPKSCHIGTPGVCQGNSGCLLEGIRVAIHRNLGGCM